MGIEGIFDRAAESYGQVGFDFFGYFAAKLIDEIAPARGSCLLDVACGTGALLTAAASVIGDEGILVGIDVSPGMLRQVTTPSGARPPHLARMDAEHLGLISASFDTVVSGFAFSYFRSPEQTMREMRRVLRTDGQLGIVFSAGWWWQDDPRWTWHANLLNRLGYRVDEADRRLRDPAIIEAILRTAGFSNLELRVERYPLVWEDFEEWWRWCWSHGYRAVLEQLSAVQLGEYKRNCSRRLDSTTVEGDLPVLIVRSV